MWNGTGILLIVRSKDVVLGIPCCFVILVRDAEPGPSCGAAKLRVFRTSDADGPRILTLPLLAEQHHFTERRSSLAWCPMLNANSA